MGSKMYFRFPVSYSISQYFTDVYVLVLILLAHTQLSHCQRRPLDPPANIPLSSPEQCARNCRDNEEPKNCYYRFHIEFYPTVGAACDVPSQRSQCIIGDGFEKTTVPINRQIPGPTIQVCENDRVIVDVENAASGMEVTMHWHGLFQNGYQYYDGVPYVTQCPIASSSTFRYDFRAQNPGTHFYHSHISTHMLDGQYGPFIIKPPPCREPFLNLYDTDEHIVFLSDWMHALSMERFPGYYRQNLGQTAENILINGLGSWTDPVTKQTSGNMTVFTVTKGKRHRMRLINSFSTVCLAEFSIEGHDLLLIAQDGANVKPRTVSSIITAAGERVDFILNANKSVGSYWIHVRGLEECAAISVYQLGILQYAGGPSIPSSPRPGYNTTLTGVVYNSLDATKCNSKDTSTTLCVNQLESLEVEPELLKVEPDERHVLNFWFFNYTEFGNRMLFKPNTYGSFFAANDKSQLLSMFNNIAYESPASSLITPTRTTYQTLCRRNQLSTCTQPCTCTQVIRSRLNNIVELVIYDQLPQSDLDHPFHLHGFEFRVFSIGQFPGKLNVTRADMDQVIKEHTQRLQRGEYTNPPGKDTVKVPMGGYAIVRFKADNPGWWLLHCHFTWHHITGMELVIYVGDEEDLPPVPPGFPKCDNWRPPLQSLNDFYGFAYPQF